MGKVLEDSTDCAPLHAHVSLSSRVSLKSKMCQGIDIEVATRADTKQKSDRLTQKHRRHITTNIAAGARIKNRIIAGSMQQSCLNRQNPFKKHRRLCITTHDGVAAVVAVVVVAVAAAAAGAAAAADCYHQYHVLGFRCMAFAEEKAKASSKADTWL